MRAGKAAEFGKGGLTKREVGVCVDGPRHRRPVEPLAFQPPKGLIPGHAPVVAPERRFA